MHKRDLSYARWAKSSDKDKVLDHFEVESLDDLYAIDRLRAG